MASSRSDAEARRQARAGWPVTRHRLGEEPGDDLSDVTTPEQRIAMMAELSESAWLATGHPLPSYDRRDIPGRLFRPGELRPDE
jgi:hypothetical protein